MQSILAFISTYKLLDQTSQIIKLSLTLIRNQEITFDHALDTANEFEGFFFRHVNVRFYGTRIHLINDPNIFFTAHINLMQTSDIKNGQPKELNQIFWLTKWKETKQNYIHKMNKI